MFDNILKNPKETVVRSFRNAWAGKEKLNNIFYWWGGVPYAICYFILHPFIMKNPILFIDWIVSFIVFAYFIFHIILICKNLPKAPVLTKDEKQKLKAERRKDLPKRLLRKLMLKEPISKWKPHHVFIAADIFVIATYLHYLF